MNVTSTENSTVPLLDEVIRSNVTTINTSPSTILSEVLNSSECNATDLMISETLNENDGPAADVVTTTMETIVTNTEKFFNTVSNNISPMVDTTASANEDVEGTSFQYSEDDKTIYIVLGIILGVLILITIILIIIYKKFKARNARSGVYCVTDLNEISISSTSDKKNIKNLGYANSFKK